MILFLSACHAHHSVSDGTVQRDNSDSISKDINMDKDSASLADADTLSSWADTAIHSGRHIYIGAITPEAEISEYGHSILIALDIKNEMISGYSYHTSKNHKYSLQGKLVAQGVFVIHEYDRDGHETGSFHFDQLYGHSLTGFWQSIQDDKKLPISLEGCDLASRDGAGYSDADTLKPPGTSQAVYGTYYSTSNAYAGDSALINHTGYYGAVDIERTQDRNSFSMAINEINFNNDGTGRIKGIAHFVTPDLGIFNKDDCSAIVFVFKKGNLLVFESECNAWHGATVQFEDWYYKKQ